MQLDGTRIHSKRYFELPEDVGLPQLPETEGPGTLDELLDPELPPMVRSAEEYRRSQLAAHGDSPGAMGLFGLNQAINRYVWGLEDRHEVLETPGERTANDIADTAHAVSSLAGTAAGAAKVGRIPNTSAKTPPPKRVTVDATMHPESAKHLRDAGVVGRPLTVNRSAAAKNRAEALKGHRKVPGRDLDEAPPAVLRQHGENASVRAIDPSDNRGAGASIGHQIREVPEGGKVIIEIREGS